VRKELEGECGNLRETISSLKIDHEERMRTMEHDICLDEHEKYT